MNRSPRFASRYALASLVAFTLLGCGDEQTSSPAHNDSSYALRGADYSWPPAAADVEIAANRLAKNYYLVFDGSGSMESEGCDSHELKISTAKHATSAFFETLPDDVNVGVLAFDAYGVRELVPLSALDRDGLRVAVERIRSGGDTPLGTSMERGYQALTQQAQKQQGYGEYNLVIITDGEASDSSHMQTMVNTIASQSSVNIHTLGFCLGTSHPLNVRGVINYMSANNAQQLLSGLKQVTAEAEQFDVADFEGVAAQ